MEAVFKLLPVKEILRVFRAGALGTREILDSAYAGVIYRVTEMEESVKPEEIADFLSAVTLDNTPFLHQGSSSSSSAPLPPGISSHGSFTDITGNSVEQVEKDLGILGSPSPPPPPPPKDRSLSDLVELEFCDIHGNSISDVEQDLDLSSINTSPAAQTGCGRDSPYFKVLRENRSFLKNFRLWGKEIVISVSPIPSGASPMVWYDSVITSLLTFLKSGLDGSARGGMSIRNEAFPNRDIHLSFRRCDQLEPFVVLQRIQKVLQSNEDFFLNGLLSISFQHVQVPQGRGRPRIPRFSDFHHYCKRMKSILVVENEDNLCLPRCIVIAISKHEDTVQNYRKLYQSKRRLKAAALSLCDRAKVVIGEGGAEVEEIRKFQLSLPEFKITVFADLRRVHTTTALTSRVGSTLHYNTLTTMEQARKMILVPRETIQRMSSIPTPPMTTTTTDLTQPISALDREMERILRLPKLSDHEKWNLYKQCLQRFLHFTDEERKPAVISFFRGTDDKKETEEEDGMENAEAAALKSDRLTSEIITSVPKKFKKKAKLLTDRLVLSKKITWDDAGTVSIDGKVLVGSNIVDLIGDIMRKRKNFSPIGLHPFLDTLGEINVPHEFIGNADHLKYIQSAHSGGTPPNPRDRETAAFRQRVVIPRKALRWVPYSFRE
ncbi:hypothetical protein J437_LFUL017011 [Ladona fulva]|uniref:Uncharacterized protein n=1 Tax=Ladona fulva TaxID=123851 RepID=A0A8K0P7J6_LADFU|nr:hypothetical protein J437_LFUL017011 [Ladona fulva]